MRFKLVKLVEEFAKNGQVNCVAVYDEARFRWVPLKPLADEFGISFFQRDETLLFDMLHILREYDGLKVTLEKALETAKGHDFSDSFEEEVNEIPFSMKSLRKRSVFEDYEVQTRRSYYKKKKKLRHYLYSKIESLANRIPGPFVPNEDFYFSPFLSYENHLNIYPSGSAIYVPECVGNVDFEGTIGMVVGNPFIADSSFRNISPDQAKDYILGFTVMSHMISRNIQVNSVDKMTTEMFATAISPEVATPDEVFPFFQMVKNELRVNDELINEGSSLYSVFQPEEVLSFASEGTEMFTGEVISLGCFPNCSGFVNEMEFSVQDKITFQVRSVGEVTTYVGDREGVTHWKRRKAIVHYFKYYKYHILASIVICLLFIFRKHTWMKLLRRKKSNK